MKKSCRPAALFSDDVVVAVVGGLVDDVLECDAVQIFVDDLIKSLPDGKSGAVDAPVAVYCSAGDAGNGSQVAFRKT